MSFQKPRYTLPYLNAAVDAASLALRIAHCEEMEAVIAGTTSRCSEIVRYQHGEPLSIDTAAHQLPEPWNGDIVRAPLLFVASNPSIDRMERFPTRDRREWSDVQVLEFFGGRFKLNSGRPSSQYWRCVRMRAAEILRLAPADVRPGEHYALTEVVHCKSRQQVGVSAAAETCSARYLEATFKLSTARIVVVLGAVATKLLYPWLGELRAGDLRADVVLGGRTRVVLGLAHPSAFGGPKTVARLSSDVRLRLRNLTFGSLPSP